MTFQQVSLALLIGASPTLGAQTRNDTAAALTVAFQQVRPDVSDGPVALQTRGLSSATALNVASGLGVEPREEVGFDCVQTTELRSCRLRDFAGVLGVTSIIVGSGTAKAIIWTSVQGETSGRSWIYRREYAIELTYEPNKGWRVRSRTLLSET